MKKILLCSLLILLCFPAASLAHPGRTDTDGGHHDYNNVSGLGSYHYHHGYSAHLHSDGICPYDYRSNSDSSSGGSISYFSSAISNTSYEDNYDTGYDEDYDNGYDDGYDISYTQTAALKDEEYRSLLVAGIVIPSALGIVGILRTRHKSSIINNSLQQEKNKLQENLNSLQNQKGEQHETVLSLQEQNNYLKNRIASLQEEIHDLQEDVDSLQIENHQLQEDVGSLQLKNFCLQEQLDSFQDDSEIAIDQKIIEKVLSIRNRPQYSTIPVFKDFSALPLESDDMRFIRSIQESMRIQNFQASAMITTKSKNTYLTTLESCECADFQNRHRTCKHMYRLAMELGLLIGTSTEEISDKLLELNSQMENIKAEQKLLEKEKTALLKTKNSKNIK